MDLWDVVLTRIEKTLVYWITKSLSLARKFQICSNILASTHVYYYSCWDPSKSITISFKRFLETFYGPHL